MNSSRAIVINSTDFGEADKYVQFYTEKWGMVTASAKAAKKSKRRFVGGLDLFCHDEIVIRGEVNPHLLELVVLNSFMGIRKDLVRLLMAGKMVTWIRKLVNTSIPMPNVFSLLGQNLALIEKEDDSFKLKVLFLVFKLKLLSLIGIKPSFSDKCFFCGSKEKEVFFDITAGYTICLNCQKPTSYSVKYVLDRELVSFINELRSIKLKEWQEFNSYSEDILKINNLVTEFTVYHTYTNLPI